MIFPFAVEGDGKEKPLSRCAAGGVSRLPQASCLFIAGLSAAMKKRQAFLCDLCASVVKGAFDRQRMLTTEVHPVKYDLSLFARNILPW